MRKIIEEKVRKDVSYKGSPDFCAGHQAGFRKGKQYVLQAINELEVDEEKITKIIASDIAYVNLYISKNELEKVDEHIKYMLINIVKSIKSGEVFK